MTYDLSLQEVSAEVINSNFAAVEEEVNSKAQKNGDSTQKFNVADAAETTEAINKGQLNTALTTVNTSIAALETEIATKANSALALKANTADVNASLALKANQADVTTALAAKADLNGNSAQAFNVANATVSTQAVNKGQLDSTVSSINSEITSIESDLAEKADTTYVDAQIAAVGGGFPDYANGVVKNWNQVYQAECNGYVAVGGVGQSDLAHAYILEIGTSPTNWVAGVSHYGGSNYSGAIVPIPKDFYYRAFTGISSQSIKFFPVLQK